ncbi:ABC transporter ATP-binding protein [Nocardioides marmoriginsengisoli]|uniref:ABC transporter ATP-binding protein n=1 Tax=Nocardioides marmoriginsengisoli TaxID=661483 RepID=A0A3N0CB38_9ACTN|nr:ABC transporter ATP-binding protein [Nocardioides marmoriginsengisoli]RNL60648.1 ABC transporter ATP-binding protein [Nocardioides marmoriginsengisoli]
MTGLEAVGVWVADSRRTLMPPTTFAVSAGEIVVVYGDPGHQHTLLALALGGRLVPAGGEVLLDGDDTLAALQRSVALVDVPGVSEPDDISRLGTIVGEELAMAGRPARAAHVETWLTANGLWARRKDRMEDLPPGTRSLALARLATQRSGLACLVLALPERHGIDADGWLETATWLAGEGFAVVATTSVGVARQIEALAPQVRTVRFGNTEFREPEQPDEPGDPFTPEEVRP